MFLVVGGDEDPNILRLVARLRSTRTRHRKLLVGANSHPVVTWDVNDDRLMLNGRRIQPTAAFIRHDVFTSTADDRPETAHRAYAWYSTLASWIASHREVRCFNRSSPGELQKPHQLRLAIQAGLDIPPTWVTNDARLLERKIRTSRLVVKPVNGGDYCQRLTPLLRQISTIDGAAANPAIVQEELVPPDIRVFCIGKRFFTYEIESDGLDYRNASYTRVKSSDAVPKFMLSKIGRVSRQMGLDYSATDLKWSDSLERLVFLEINSAPMFAAFDVASEGALCDAIVEQLAT